MKFIKNPLILLIIVLTIVQVIISCSNDGFESELALGKQEQRIYCQAGSECSLVSESICTEIGGERVPDCSTEILLSSSSEDITVSSSSSVDPECEEGDEECGDISSSSSEDSSSSSRDDASSSSEEDTSSSSENDGSSSSSDDGDSSSSGGDAAPEPIAGELKLKGYLDRDKPFEWDPNRYRYFYSKNTLLDTIIDPTSITNAQALCDNFEFTIVDGEESTQQPGNIEVKATVTCNGTLYEDLWEDNVHITIVPDPTFDVCYAYLHTGDTDIVKLKDDYGRCTVKYSINSGAFNNLSLTSNVGQNVSIKAQAECRDISTPISKECASAHVYAQANYDGTQEVCGGNFKPKLGTTVFETCSYDGTKPNQIACDGDVSVESYKIDGAVAGVGWGSATNLDKAKGMRVLIERTAGNAEGLTCVFW
ncbi:MAG: hypothetical protein LBB36_05395 [Fibromonadaceae bacterium]|jgi:hypothetical protein|nr:hypothetical protein [Fibromonadaceae bacterium]